MRPNTAGRLAARGTSLPVASGTGMMARRMLTRVPRPTETKELTWGMTVLKLLAAMNDEKQAPGIEIGRPSDSFRRVAITSTFGKAAVFVTDGHLPYPYGHEMTGYEVADLSQTLNKATAAGARILVPAYPVGSKRQAAIVQFPGGYIAVIHAPTR